MSKKEANRRKKERRKTLGKENEEEEREAQGTSGWPCPFPGPSEAPSD